ncbi:MAG: hypothetical protein HRU70_12480 [Phycisphaeraceae bacterium]|nr:MAG: hypothetical protein HRU70_12480 [Phycisphaeraceae bacterium]
MAIGSDSDASHHRATLPGSSRSPAPIGAVIAFTMLNSVGTATVTNGIYYITDSGYGFTRGLNLGLGVTIGASYIAGAALAWRVPAWLRSVIPGLTSRGMLLLLMALMGAVCLIPMALVLSGFGPLTSQGQVEGRAGTAGMVGVVGVWGVIVVYSALSGVLWPVVESFLSGGRRGEGLRRVMGWWNVSWAGSALMAQILMSPLVKDDPQTAVFEPALILAATGVIHAAAALVLARLPREPAPHEDEHHGAHPADYPRLLITFRLLLPMGYVVLSALAPILAWLLESLGVPDRERPVYGAAWIVPRVIMFWVLSRWHGWEGRWWAAIAGGGLIVGGFGVALLAPILVPEQGTLVITLVGLGVFGTGMALVYTAAIYYAMEVGRSQVAAGGTHESLIGVGYLLGPMCGLAAESAVALRIIPPSGFGPALFGVVGVLALGTTLVVIRRVWKLSSTPVVRTGEDRGGG